MRSRSGPLKNWGRRPRIRADRINILEELTFTQWEVLREAVDLATLYPSVWTST